MRNLRFLIVLCSLSTVLAAADSPLAGTWKLNVAKTKYLPGTGMKELTVTFEAVGGEMKRAATGVDIDGQPVKDETTSAWDGKDHQPIEGGGPGMTVAVLPAGRTLNVTIKRTGQVIDRIKATVSKDGKMMTIVEKGIDNKGRKVDSVEIYAKQ